MFKKTAACARAWAVVSGGVGADGGGWPVAAVSVAATVVAVTVMVAVTTATAALGDSGHVGGSGGDAEWSSRGWTRWDEVLT